MSDAYDPLDNEEEVDETPEGEEDESSEGSFEDDEGGEDEGDEDEGSPAGRTPEGDGEEPSGRQRPQATQRFQRRVAREIDRATAPLREELDRLRAQTAQPRTPQETPAQRQTRLDAMDPWEREAYLREEQEARHRNDIAQIRFETADAADRTAFESECARNPTASKLKAEVEQRLADMRRNGTNAPRGTVLRFIIGDRALANAGKVKGRQQKTAEQNRQRQAGRPGNSRSDQGGGRERGGLSEREARAKRLEDQAI